jgi:quinol---cytochrome c reductase iron-sulfur subunit, bacillus type
MKSMSATPNGGRRMFLVGAIYGLWALIGAALSLPAAVYLLLPPKARKREEWVEAGDLSRLDVNDPEEVVFRKNRVDGWKISSEKTSAWVVKLSDNTAVAFAPSCTHLGCAYHWDERKKNFLCPCHTSTFGVDGRVLSGPAPRALDRYAVEIKGGKILLGEVQKPEES